MNPTFKELLSLYLDPKNIGLARLAVVACDYSAPVHARAARSALSIRLAEAGRP